jgi:hypothetical protein
MLGVYLSRAFVGRVVPKDSGKEDHYIVRRGTKCESRTKLEIRSMVQSVLSASVNLSTLIGSGASLPAVPLMGTTFTNFRDELREDPAKKDLCKWLEDRVNILCRKLSLNDASKFTDIEYFLSWLSYRIDGDVADSEQDKKIFDELKQQFLDTVRKGDSPSDKFQLTLEHYRNTIQGLGESRQILGRQQRSFFDIVNVFTTNYDLYIERALEDSRYSYTDGFTNGISSKFSAREFHRRPVDLEDRFKDHLELVNPFFRLIKLHGSINWVRDGETIFRSNENPDIDNVTISPTSSKFALTQNEPYSDLFREFVNIMAVPNTVLFTVGFSFGDAHVANLIKNALARPDFTLYAFVENSSCTDSDSELSKFVHSVNSPNAFFISPDCEEDKETADLLGCPWSNPPLKFEDFAFFVGANVIKTDSEAQNADDSENN